MTELRKKEFIEMLFQASLSFDDKDKFIHCDIPTLGKITYYPKANKVQVSKTNTWEENGLEYVKRILNTTTKSDGFKVMDNGKTNHNELKKVQEIFSLMVLAKMSLTEINTLTENERSLLSEIFINKEKEEMKFNKRKS